MSKTRVSLVGLGATGVAIGNVLARRTDVSLQGGADPRPGLVGKDLGSVLGGQELGVTVVDSSACLPDADVAVVATSSMLDVVAETVAPLLERGINVVSICEELAYPHVSHPRLARQLDELARQNGVTLLGTGANPGIIMDTLPLLLSSMTQQAHRVVIRRSADMSRYGAILEKFGLGLTPEQFGLAQRRGAVIGHVGFEQSVAALGSGLGWRLDEIEVDDVRPVRITDRARHGRRRSLEAGTVSAVRHAARGLIADHAVIDLEINFGFFEPGDDIAPGDRCRIEGVDQNIEVAATAGYESHLSTVAVTANVVTAVAEAPPGLRSMAELPVVSFASRGAWTNVDQRGQP